ncbi:MAG: electron transport complex subunit RsxG [Gammaproteobacteria bacterium]|nr:MAG: electron transport complex subunit RsxG [Gammaproteobacteria bacterium]
MPRQALRTGLLLGAFALGGTLLVAATHQLTAQRIAANERAYLLRTLHELIPAGLYDNDLVRDRILVRDPLLGSREPLPVFRARKGGRPVAAVLTAVAPDGYGGAIRLLVGVRYDGTVLGVRILSHKETPGLGDAIDQSKSPWVESFRGKRLGDPPARLWRVKKDGGVFDQFTGATISPRAVVAAVRRALEYYTRHRDEIFAAPAVQEAPHG